MTRHQGQLLDRSARAVAFTVFGRVQGVAFRWYGRKAAQDLGVAGWILNRADGSVEGEAYGEADQLERFLSSLRRGPTASRVERLDWVTIPRDEAPPTFEVRY